jgi:hypothetical protein
VPAKRAPVLDTVTRVLERSGQPMRAAAIHAAATELQGGPLRWASVKEAVSASTTGGDRRFDEAARNRQADGGSYLVSIAQSSIDIVVG